VETDKELKVVARSIGEVTPYFKDRPKEDWNLFVESLIGYLELHPDIETLTTELIEDILKGS
jgi:hypothetical protein